MSRFPFAALAVALASSASASEVLQLRQGTAAQVQAYVPALGEPVYDTTDNRLYLGDGATAGGNGVVMQHDLASAVTSSLLSGSLTGLLVGNGASAATAITPGAGVAAGLAAAINGSGGFVGYSGALGTPASGVLTHATGLPVATGISGLGSGVAGALAQPVGGAGGLAGLVSPSINVGNVCGYPTANQACVAGSTAAGLMPGNIAIGNNVSGVDAFVHELIDNAYVNPNQEMRGVTVALRESRGVADASIGWDMIPFSGAIDIQAANTQSIIGNLKGFFGETILESPTTGSYTVRSAYPFQSLLYQVGANVTLTYWAGVLIDGRFSGSGVCTQCFGLDIYPLQGTSTAAINLRGQGLGQGISFQHNTVYEDSSADLILYNSGAGSIEVNDTFIPNADNAVALGTASARWSLVSAAEFKSGPYTIATLPTCSSTTWGSQTFVSNGIASPTTHQAVSATGGAGWPVYCGYNGSSYGWVY